MPNRLETFFPTAAPRITQTPERGVLFGQPVANLREWASVGANSDAFAVSTKGLLEAAHRARAAVG